MDLAAAGRDDDGWVDWLARPGAAEAAERFRRDRPGRLDVGVGRRSPRGSLWPGGCCWRPGCTGSTRSWRWGSAPQSRARPRRALSTSSWSICPSPRPSPPKVANLRGADRDHPLQGPDRGRRLGGPPAARRLRARRRARGSGQPAADATGRRNRGRSAAAPLRPPPSAMGSVFEARRGRGPAGALVRQLRVLRRRCPPRWWGHGGVSGSGGRSGEAGASPSPRAASCSWSAPAAGACSTDAPASGGVEKLLGLGDQVGWPPPRPRRRRRCPHRERSRTSRELGVSALVRRHQAPRSPPRPRRRSARRRGYQASPDPITRRERRHPAPPGPAAPSSVSPRCCSDAVVPACSTAQGCSGGEYPSGPEDLQRGDPRGCPRRPAARHGPVLGPVPGW